MRKTALTLVLAASSALAAAAPISIVASDNFDSYGAGALNGANGGSGFSGAWAGATGASVVSTTSPADDPMSGQALQFTQPNSSNAAVRNLDRSISEDVLVSFQFQFNGGTIEDNDFMALWFGDSDGPNIGLKANCGNGSCTADLFTRTAFGDAAYTTPIVVGSTYRMLGYLQKTGGSSVYNKYSLWVGQDMVTDTSELGAASFVFDTGASSVSSFSTIGFRTFGVDSADSLLVDNLRIAVVPTPGTLALAGLGLFGMMGLAAARRRRA